jgi:trk system potassium uptake protein TrkA
MHIVIIGGGQVGSSLARALSGDHDVVVVDYSPEVADVFQSMDVEFLLGSGTSADVLQQAGVAHADFFVAATALDEVNIVACALANRLGKPETICLVSRAEFLEGGSLGAFGITRVVWPEAQLAADIEQIVTSPGAIDAEVFAGGVVRLLEYRLDGTSPLTGVTLGALHLPRGSLVVAVKRAGRIFVPRGATTLQEGDKVILMGTPEAMREVEALVQTGRTGGRLQVTIIGGGDVGLQLAERLEKTPSVDLRILERGLDRLEAGAR